MGSATPPRTARTALDCTLFYRYTPEGGSHWCEKTRKGVRPVRLTLSMRYPSTTLADLHFTIGRFPPATTEGAMTLLVDVYRDIDEHV